MNPGAAKRTNLVFIRAGTNSLHRRLIAEDPDRNWDCFVNWYTTPGVDDCAEYYSTQGFNKYEGFSLAWQSRLSQSGYRRIALLDDDVLFAPGDISRMFRFCEQYDLALSQPALRWGSNMNHVVSLWNPFACFRRTSFVEVMMPFFSVRMLQYLLPTMSQTRSTWGLDHIWASLLEGFGETAVVDAVRVHHLKPSRHRNGSFYRYLAMSGIDPYAELAEARRLYPLTSGYRTLDCGHRYRGAFPARILAIPFGLLERNKRRLHRFLKYRQMVF